MSSRLLRETIRHMLVGPDDRIGAIYCDMDGVLVDFESGAIDLVSKILDGSANPVWTSGSKSMRRNIQALIDEKGPDWRPHSGHDLQVKGVRQIMLSAIASSPGEFFSSLSPLTDGVEDLWPFLNEIGPPVHILSAPVKGRDGSGPTAGDGKRDWCRRYLNPAPVSIIIADATDKANWAIAGGVPNILVDDKGTTIDTWNARGGLGFLHFPGNSMRSISMLQGRFTRG